MANETLWAWSLVVQSVGWSLRVRTSLLNFNRAPREGKRSVIRGRRSTVCEGDDFRALTLIGGIIAATGGPICVSEVVATVALWLEGGVDIGTGLLLPLGTPAAILGGVTLLVVAVGSLVRRRGRMSDA